MRALGQVFTEQVLQPPEGVRVTGCKEVRYFDEGVQTLGLIDFIVSAFPDAYLLLNSRNHEDVVRSGMWRRRKKADALKLLRRAEKAMNDILMAHPDRCVHVRYEDYTRDPAALAPAFELVGAHYDERHVLEKLGQRLTHGQSIRAPRPRLRFKAIIQGCNPF